MAADDLGRSDERPPLVLLHGLTFDRRMWRSALTALELVDPGRRVIALDLPGHGESPDAPAYSMEVIVERIHDAIMEAHLEDPVIVGHSASAGYASVYATRYPTRGVIAVEGTLLVGSFAAMAQSFKSMLRGPEFANAWAQITAGAFRLEEVAPDVRAFVRMTSRPRQEIVLGYWQDLLERNPAELDAWVGWGARAIRELGIPYVSVVGQDPSPEDVAWVKANQPEMRTLVWHESGTSTCRVPKRFAELLAEQTNG